MPPEFGPHQPDEEDLRVSYHFIHKVENPCFLYTEGISKRLKEHFFVISSLGPNLPFLFSSSAVLCLLVIFFLFLSLALFFLRHGQVRDIRLHLKELDCASDTH
jgi:hypothetical protein